MWARDFWKPIFRMLGTIILIPVFVLLMFGGLLFWAPNLMGMFAFSAKDKNDYEIARSGLVTMKRMTGDQKAWSLAVQQEYNQLFAGNSNNSALATGEVKSSTYAANFIEARTSPNP